MLKLASALMVVLMSLTAAAQVADIPLPPPPPPGGGPVTPPPRATPAPPTDPSYPTDPNQPLPPAPPSGPTRDYVYTMGSAQTTRSSSQVFSFAPQVGLEQIHTLQLVGTFKKVEIEGVSVTYADGSTSNVYGMGGTLKEGDAQIGRLTGAPVYQVRIQAKTGGIFRRDGAFRLDAVATGPQ
jgi:hypothetical protein